MTLFINVIENHLLLELKVNRKLIDDFEGTIDKDLDRQLLEGLDKIFKRNRLDKLALKTVEISRNIDQNSTFYRIILAFKKGLLSTK